MLGFSKIIGIIKKAAKELSKKHPLILASSTAFFTTFSIPPMTIIIVNVLSLYFKTGSLSAKFNNQITQVFGQDSAEQLQVIASNLSAMGSQWWITVAGSVFLIFVATNLFKVIKTSINQIWSIRTNKKKNFWLSLKTRGIALGFILLTGILFLLSTVADSLISVLKDYLEHSLPIADTILIVGISKLTTLLFMALWFMTIFRYLPDARIHWKAIMIGGIVTAVLFMIGKLALEEFLVKSNIGSVFETSASIVLILLFIFYSSLIMYYGAAFTLVVSQELNKTVKPTKYAEQYEVKTMEK